MKRPDRLASSQGLLLVEAVLSAVVIAVGLTFITRGLGGQLRALEAVEAYDKLLPLAQSKFNELEGLGLKQKAIPNSELEGNFDAPSGYHWQLEKKSHTVSSGAPALTDVTLMVFSEANPKRKVSLSGVWPTAWLEGG